MTGITQSGSYANPRLDLGEAMWEFLFSPADFIGSRLYASFGVPKKSASFPKIRREDLLKPGSKVKRAPKAKYERDGFSPEDDSYTCVERGHEIPLDESDIAFYASDFDAEMVAAEMALWRVLYDQEQDIANTVLDGTTTYTVANGRRTDITTAWSNVAATIISDVVTAVESVRSRTGTKANTLAIGAAVLPFLLKNTEIRDAISPTRLPGVDAILAALAALFGLDQVLIGNGVYNSAKKGQSFAKSDIWTSGWAVVARCAMPGQNLATPCVGRTLYWTAESNESALIEDYIEPQTRSKVIRARSFATEKEIDPDFQQLLDIAG